MRTGTQSLSVADHCVGVVRVLLCKGFDWSGKRKDDEGWGLRRVNDSVRTVCTRRVRQNWINTWANNSTDSKNRVQRKTCSHVCLWTIPYSHQVGTFSSTTDVETILPLLTAWMVSHHTNNQVTIRIKRNKTVQQ